MDKVETAISAARTRFARNPVASRAPFAIAQRSRAAHATLPHEQAWKTQANVYGLRDRADRAPDRFRNLSARADGHPHRAGHRRMGCIAQRDALRGRTRLLGIWPGPDR